MDRTTIKRLVVAFFLVMVLLVVLCSLCPILFVQKDFGAIGCNKLIEPHDKFNTTLPLDINLNCNYNFVIEQLKQELYWFGRIEELTSLNQGMTI